MPAEANFYEILEVPADATLQEIERSYRIGRATYSQGSMATYSVFSEEESVEILARIEEAYSVLSDARLRREYDARLRRQGVNPTPRSASPEAEETPVEAPKPTRSPERAPPEPIDLEPELEPDDGVYDGPVLRRIRMSLGIEVEDISNWTKINEMYLGFIEANRYDDLPAIVYVRGFVKEYAKYVHLDPKLVADTYLARMKERTGREL